MSAIWRIGTWKATVPNVLSTTKKRYDCPTPTSVPMIRPVSDEARLHQERARHARNDDSLTLGATDPADDSAPCG
jgi:hypothetical protein